MIVSIITNNKNVAHIARYLEEGGAVILAVGYGRKHITVRFRTKEGITSLTRVSSSPMDPMKLRNYARQSINRAAQREHVRQQTENHRR